MEVYSKESEGADCLPVAGFAMALLSQLTLWGCVLNSGGALLTWGPGYQSHIYAGCSNVGSSPLA